MKNKEFYKSNEYNKTKEYQHFPAEMYLSKNDINFTGIEKPNTGQEITTINSSPKHNKTNDGSKNLLSKIFDGLKSIATTAIVGVASIVATTSIATTKPDIDLLNLNQGSNYVEYSISAKDIKEDTDYLVVISTSNEKDIEFEITSDGIYENKVEGLKSEWEYKISVIGKDDFLGDITYFEKKFQTTKNDNHLNSEQTPEPELPNYFDGNYVKPNIDDAIITWDSQNQKYNISLNITCDEMNENYFYKLVAYDENNNILSTYKDTKNANSTLIIDKNTTIFNVFFEIYATNERETKLIESAEVGKIDLSTPTLDIENVTISGANILEINYKFDDKNYNAENIDNLLFNISYGDNNNEIIEIQYDELIIGKKILNVSENITSININSSFIFTNNKFSREIISEEKTFELNNDFEIQYSIDIYNKYIILKPIGLFGDVTSVCVSTSENETKESYDLFYDIYIPYENSGEITLSYYLSNERGEELSSEQTIIVDTTFEGINYNFNYKNPGDVGITYNSNGSINLYIDTNFMCEDEDVYYQIKLINYDLNLTLYYTFKEEIAIITNLPNTNYGITYEVCKDINDIQYSFMNVTPSGTINETNYDYTISGIILENECQFALEYYNTIFDLSTVKAIGSNNEEIILTETDFTNNIDEYNYSASLTFSEEVSSVTIYIKCNQYYLGLEQIDESKIIGSRYLEIQYTIYAE